MRRVPAHPLFIAAFPVVFLFGQNAERVRFGKVVLPLAVVVAATVAIGLVSSLLLRDIRRGAVMASGLSFLVLSYGHVASVTGIRDLVLVPVFGVVGAGVCVGAWRLRKTGDVTAILNALGIGLFVVSVVGALTAVSSRAGATQTRMGERAEPVPSSSGEGTDRDIYFLVFDRYGSAPVLRSHLGYDDSAFVEGLRERGFYVAEGSDSNYPTTAHSLASSMNMTYVDDVAERAGETSKDWGPLYERIVGPKAVRFLQERGYRYAHIGAWYDPTAHDPTAHVNYHYDKRSEFTRVLLATTMIDPIVKRFGFLEELDGRRVAHNQIRFQFDSILDASRLDGPTFTFAHILLPHEPFTFDADGTYVAEDPVEPDGWDRAFLDQTRYASERITEIVDALLSGPEGTDPIVILQADEGPKRFDALAFGNEERWVDASDATLDLKFGILNAFYLPGLDDDAGLYPSITPVNTFRVLFNAYFGTTLELLDDELFVYGNGDEPYLLTEVTERVR